MKKIIVPVLVISIAIFSCQKEMDESSLLNPPITNLLDSSYLDKIYDMDSVAGVTDTFGYSVYGYDAQKRVTTLNYYTLENGSTELFSSDQYFYHTSDSLPYKAIFIGYESSIAGNDPDTATYFYTYNNEGKNLLDSLVIVNHYNGTLSMRIATTTYSYAPNRIYSSNSGRQVLPTPSVFPDESRDTAITDAYDNILFSKKYLYQQGADTFLAVNSSFTYDNKPNPFSKLSNFRTLGVTPFGETFFYEMQAKNNRLKALETYYSSPFSTGEIFDEDLTDKYTYFPNGYPKRITDSDGAGNFYIWVFTYKSL